MSALAWFTGLAAAPEGVFSLPSYNNLFLIDFSGWDPGTFRSAHLLVPGEEVASCMPWSLAVWPGTLHIYS